MADSTLDILRQEVLARRMKSAGRIHWAPEQFAEVHDFIMAAPREKLLAATQRKFVDPGREIGEIRTKLVADGTVASSDVQAASETMFACVITTEQTDLMGDKVFAASVRKNENTPVLLAHDANSLPIARSSAFWKVGTSTLANVIFPEKGVYGASDQAAAMVRAGQLKGCSIGFKPIRFKMSTDPERPFGIDFLDILVIEWSLCACPANQSCWVIGPVSPKSAQRATGVAMTREDRIAEAQTFRHLSPAATYR
jgi:phage head maturation protease